MPPRQGPDQGLRLTLPGAPLEPHIVLTASGQPIPGYYTPHIPAPVGGQGELTAEQAAAYAAEPHLAVELVPMSAGEAEVARAFFASHRERVRTGSIAKYPEHNAGDEVIAAAPIAKPEPETEEV